MAWKLKKSEDVPDKFWLFFDSKHKFRSGTLKVYDKELDEIISLLKKRSAEKNKNAEATDEAISVMFKGAGVYLALLKDDQSYPVLVQKFSCGHYFRIEGGKRHIYTKDSFLYLSKTEITFPSPFFKKG